MAVVTRRLTLVLLALGLFSPNLRAVEAFGGTTVDLTPQIAPNEFARTTIEIEVGGTMSVRDGAGTSASIRTLPMSVAAKLEYDEQRVPPAGGTSRLATRAIRYYNEAGAVIKVEDDGATPKLTDDNRLIVVQNPRGRLAFTAPRGLLTREELDLVDVTGDSLALDALLPAKEVANGDSWAADADAIAAILSLDTVAACEVQSVLDKFNEDFALIKLAGTVVGTVDGSATEMEIRGAYLFDCRLRRVTRFNLAVKELRSIGGATPGLDAVAKLKVNISPLASSPNLPEATLANLRTTNKLRLNLIRLDAPQQGYRVFHDRRWYITRRERETTTLRCVDRGEMLAQCTITSLPAKSAGRHTTLDEFERDIRLSLKDNFGELVASRQWNNSFKHQCLEVIVRGTIDQVPVEWHYYLVAPEDGPRVSIAVTIEGQMVNRLAAADRSLVDGIELVPPTAKLAGKEANQK